MVARRSRLAPRAEGLDPLGRRRGLALRLAPSLAAPPAARSLTPAPPPPGFAGAGSPLSPAAFAQACDALGIAPAVLWAVLEVETSGFGFLADRRPKILFERHVFSERTGRRFDAVAPALSHRKPGGYGAAGANQYGRLARALALDAAAALESASWGLGQVMGYNAGAAGFASAQALAAASCESEDAQLLAMCAFIAHHGLDAPLRARDWAAFARRYNGPAYAAHDYHGKLARRHDALANGRLPDLAARQAQAALLFLGHARPGCVDGRFGAASAKALAAFQADEGLAPTHGVLDGDTVDRLNRRVGWRAARPEPPAA